MCFNYNLTVEDIQAQAQALVEFHAQFAPYFQTQTRDASGQALEYLKGQLLCPARRNMSRMSTEVTQTNNQALSHFISTSPWEEEPLMEALGQEAVKQLAGEEEPGALILDESGIPKQGTKSVGVARQYCGALGKVDNCQVGVFLAYARGQEATLIDKRLYLPQEWTDDPARCEEAGVPADAMGFRTKAELGLEMILTARARGLPFEFVGMDAHYGEQPWLLSQLEAPPEPIPYMAEIPCTTRVYLDYPSIGIPPPKGTRGRKPSKVRVLDGEPREVRQMLETDHLQWQPMKIRDIQRGELWIRFAALRVYRIQDQLPVQTPVWLCIRQEIDGSDVTFAFSNAPADTPLEVLARWLCTRYWVERALQDAKGLAGLDEYQVIGWRGWHHHMAMVLLAMVFLVSLKHQLRDKAPLLTLQDAKQILEQVMPKKDLSLEDAVQIIRQKHLNRFRSRISFLKKQKTWLATNRLLM